MFKSGKNEFNFFIRQTITILYPAIAFISFTFYRITDISSDLMTI